MARNLFRSLAFGLAALACLATFNTAAQAGPPLICHPYEVGDAKSLPWGGSAWRDVKKDYDLNRLPDDTLALLGPEAPVIVRMETLRRATVYAVWSVFDREVDYKVNDLRVANDLLARLEKRAAEARGKGKLEALALFDMGFLAECYRQSAHESKAGALTRGIDGYGAVVKAINLGGGDPEMEFAAALITIWPKRETHQQHLRKAVAGAAEGSLLARNLVSHFDDRGRTIGELRANLGATKN